MAYELSEQKKVGLGLLGFGILFSFLGVVLFFDRGLLALGNVFWLTGVALLLGWSSMWNVFTNKENIKGSASFLLGLFFLFVRWPILGIILELYGCLVLFGGFWPTVKVFLCEVPFLGWVIRYIFWNIIVPVKSVTFVRHKELVHVCTAKSLTIEKMSLVWEIAVAKDVLSELVWKKVQ